MGRVDDLIAFVTARLDEDAYYAKRAGGHEFTFDSHGQLLVSNGATISKVANLGVQVSGWHIARHDPARVLREIAAGRAILARYEDCLARMDDPAYSGAAEYVQIREYEDFVLPNLAAVWDGHPDYRPEWKP
jgi:Family of unknown function (DUF6221)